MNLIGCGIKGQHKNQSSLHTSNKTRTEILKIHTHAIYNSLPKMKWKIYKICTASVCRKLQKLNAESNERRSKLMESS